MLTDPPKVKKPYCLIGVSIFAGAIIIALFLWNGYFHEDGYVRIKTETFEIIGRRLMMQKGEYFTGIFYAHAPIFKLPIKAPPLQGIIDATIWSDGCPNARNLGIGQFCTRLNVYRCGPPENDTLYPVLVYFPGLDFSWQNNAHLDPAVIIPKIACNGLVFVTADYRVGPYGFFTTHDEIAPGNLGLYDTKAALEWVYENIVYFGGNPSQVTVMGSRLGADLVSLLSLQPETAQLFQQSILISGSAFVPSLIADGAREESAMKKFFDPSKEFAVEIECATDDRWAKGINDSSAIFECIRDLKDRRIPIAEAVKRMNPRAWIKWPLFVDGKLVKNSSENIQITHKTMPTLIGLCPANMARKVNLRKEDIFSRLDIVQDLWNLNRSDIYFTHYADLLSDFKTIGTEESKQTQLSALVNQVYQDVLQIGPLLKESYGRAAQGDKVYVFDYSFLQSENRLKRDSALREKRENRINEPCGLDVLFNKARQEFDESLADKMAEILTNFVVKSDPTPRKSVKNSVTWPAFSLATEYYLHIRSSETSFDSITLRQLPYRESAEFWLCELPKKYGKADLCKELSNMNAENE